MAHTDISLLSMHEKSEICIKAIFVADPLVYMCRSTAHKISNPYPNKNGIRSSRFQILIITSVNIANHHKLVKYPTNQFKDQLAHPRNTVHEKKSSLWPHKSTINIFEAVVQNIILIWSSNIEVEREDLIKLPS
jgi:hypothetical protein